MRLITHTFIIVLSLLMTSCTLFQLPSSKVYWIDVRSAKEYNQQHFSPAKNIPHSDIEQRISEITNDKNATIYLYCGSGKRAGIAKTKLESLGFNQVINQGGIEDVLNNHNKNNKTINQN